MRGPHGKLWTELFFSSFYGPSAKGADHANKEGKNDRGSITCRTDRANEANKMFITWLCWLIPGKERNYLTYWWVIKSWTSVYGYLRTWNWPITAREISQPYNKTIYFTGISYDGANTSLFNTSASFRGNPCVFLGKPVYRDSCTISGYAICTVDWLRSSWFYERCDEQCEPSDKTR